MKVWLIVILVNASQDHLFMEYDTETECKAHLAQVQEKYNDKTLYTSEFECIEGINLKKKKGWFE